MWLKCTSMAGKGMLLRHRVSRCCNAVRARVDDNAVITAKGLLDFIDQNAFNI